MTSLTESLLVFLPLNTQHGSPQGSVAALGQNRTACAEKAVTFSIIP